MPRRLDTLLVTAVAALVTVSGLSVPAHAGGKSLPLSLTTQLNTECIGMSDVIVDSNCAGDQTSSYVESTLPASGSMVTVGGVQFRWTTSGLRTNDTVQAANQELQVPPGTKGYKGIALLCAHHGDSDINSLLTIRYVDGSRDQVPVIAHDWKHAQADTVIPGVRVQYLADTASTVLFNHEGSVSLAVAPVNPKKAIKSIILPGDNSLLVFSVSLAPISKTPKKVTYAP